MKAIRIIIAIVVIGIRFVGICQAEEETDVRKVRWGMNKDEVQKQEADTPEQETLVYRTKFLEHV